MQTLHRVRQGLGALRERPDAETSFHGHYPCGMLPAEDGKLLRLLVRLCQSKRALEVGTGAAYSSLWLAEALRETGGRLTSVESDPALAALAAENVAAAGVDDIVRVVHGDAVRAVASLEGTFDFVFIDGHKPEYLDYFDALFPLLEPGGLIAAHDIAGMPDHMRDYFDMLKAHPDLETVITTDVTGDPCAVVTGPGLAISRKRPGAARDARPWARRFARSIAGDVSGLAAAGEPVFEVLAEVEETRFRGALVLVEAAASKEQILTLCRRLRRAHESRFPGFRLSVHVYRDRAAFERRNDLNGDPARYFDGCVARVCLDPRAGLDETCYYPERLLLTPH